MALATFYHPALEQTDTRVILSANESAHATKSRRLREGSPIQLINGQGLLAQAIIVGQSKREITVEIKSVQKSLTKSSIRIATAIPKGDRQRTMVDMLTQLAVKEIIPLSCDHSITYYKSSMQEKWQRFAIEACKQSQNLWLPKISSERSISELLTESDEKIIYADAKGQSILSLKDNVPGRLTILIGPEGGFSDKEKSLLEGACTPVSLGENILRTELACVICVSQARFICV